MKKLLLAIFLISVGIVGCDVPYTGPALTVNDVNRFLKSKGEDTVCVHDGFDSVCLRVVQEEEEPDDPPIIHVHPTGVMYEFYYEGRLVLRAERAMDTTEIAEALIAKGIAELPVDGEHLDDDQGGNGEITDVSEGWTIQIYYPPSFPEGERGKTPKTSGFDIRVAEGMRFFADGRNDLKIKDFTQIDEPNDRRGVQLSVETEASAIIIRVSGLVPLHNAKFRINIDGVASDEGTNTFQLDPVQ